MSEHQTKRLPLIGITAGLDEKGFLRLRGGYLDSVALAGGIPVPLPVNGSEEMLRAAFERVDGLIISGGEDVDPARYREEREPECQDPSPLRDRLDFLMADLARKTGKPVLGICRGCQVMNAACGGTLIQDIETALGVKRSVHVQPEDYSVVTHCVDLVPGSPVSVITGREFLMVNSRHHQCVKDLAPGLELDGRSRDDGIIEAFHDPKHPFFVAVQWHPEMLSAQRPEALALFRALAAAASVSAQH